MTLMENVIVEVLKHVKSQCQAELAVFESNLIIPSRPFPRYSSESAFNRYGRDFEQILSDTEKSLFWITDYKREFYDKEDPNRPGHYINYDLFIRKVLMKLFQEENVNMNMRLFSEN